MQFPLWRRALLTAGIMACVLLAAWVWLRAENARRLQSWEESIATLGDADVAEHFQWAESLGSAAWPALARALASDRSVVFLAARLELRRATDETLALPAERRVAPSEMLLRALNDASPAYTLRSQAAAAALARQLMAGPWPAEVDARSLVALAQPLLEQEPPPRSAPTDEPRDVDPTALRPVTSDVTLRALPPVKESPADLESHLTAPVLSGSPTPLRIVVEEPSATPLEVDSDEEAPNEALALSSFEGDSAARGAWLLKFPGPAKVRELLLRAIQGGQDETTAKTELTALGVAGWRYELLRSMLDPSPAVRRRAVEESPGRLGGEATVWLQWLAADEAAEVRLAALTFFATSGDPRVVRELAGAAGRDSDPKIRALGERLGRRP